MNAVTITPEQWASIQTQTTCGMCLAIGEHCDDCPTTAVLVVPGVWNNAGHGNIRIAPTSWTDLTGERVELWATCDHDTDDCPFNRRVGIACTVLVATASVEVLPVVEPGEQIGVDTILVADGLTSLHRGELWRYITLEPLPVPSRDWVVVLTDIEVAP